MSFLIERKVIISVFANYLFLIEPLIKSFTFLQLPVLSHLPRQINDGSFCRLQKPDSVFLSVNHLLVHLAVQWEMKQLLSRRKVGISFIYVPGLLQGFHDNFSNFQLFHTRAERRGWVVDSFLDQDLPKQITKEDTSGSARGVRRKCRKGSLKLMNAQHSSQRVSFDIITCKNCVPKF